jgi:ubiquinone/menaquinone biosynthesis C-methylase UbiE
MGLLMTSSEVAAFWEANADTWARHARAGYDVYRDGLNTPAFLDMLPPIKGLAGLDIGCGEGANTRALARLGARMTAIDIAPTFIRYAQADENANPLGIRYLVGDGAVLPFADGSFDFAAAFMSLMDMSDLERALQESARVLRPGGFLQFSILHPCFAPPYRNVLREADGTVTSIAIARYFDCVEGELEIWSFSSLPADERAKSEPFRVPRFHRTLSAWVDLILQAGFSMEKFCEPSATNEQIQRVPALADTRVAPLFLIVRARRAA